MWNKHNTQVSYTFGVKPAEHLQEVLKNYTRDIWSERHQHWQAKAKYLKPEWQIY